MRQVSFSLVVPARILQRAMQMHICLARAASLQWAAWRWPAAGCRSAAHTRCWLLLLTRPAAAAEYMLCCHAGATSACWAASSNWVACWGPH